MVNTYLVWSSGAMVHPAIRFGSHKRQDRKRDQDHEPHEIVSTKGSRL